MATMNKTLIVMGCIALFLTSSTVVNAQILSPIAYLEGKISNDTMAFFVGKTEVSGVFQGYETDMIIFITPSKKVIRYLLLI